MNHCNICGQRAETKKAIVNGVYRRHVCDMCLGRGSHIPRDGEYKRARDREDMAKEILQPFDSTGNINRDFAEAYQKESEQMFGKEKLKEF